MPFRGATDEALYHAVRNEDPKPPSQLNSAISPQFEKVLLRCLEKNPAKRYASSGELNSALRKIFGGSSGGADPPGNLPDDPLKRAWPVVHRDDCRDIHRWAEVWRNAAAKRAALVALVVLALMLAAYFFRGGAAGNDTRTVTIEAADGPADVYANGERVGKTPYRVEVHMGDNVQLELRRSGYLDQPVQFDVTERKVYSYTLQQARR